MTVRRWLFGHIARMPDTVPTACSVRDGRRPSTYWRRPRGQPMVVPGHQRVTDVLRLALDRFDVEIARYGRFLLSFITPRRQYPDTYTRH